MSDTNRAEDEVVLALNPDEDDTSANAPTPRPERPADGAPKAKWVDYVVALGADRDYVAGDTDHWDDDDPAPHYVTHPGLTRDELRGLADRLGG